MEDVQFPEHAQGTSGEATNPLDDQRYSQEPDPKRPKLTNKPQPRPRSLIIYGASKLGKTIWARSLGRHHYFNRQFGTAQMVDDAEYAVFDDMDRGLLGFDYKAWMGGQNQFSIVDKYISPRTVYWNKPVIVLMNDDEYQRNKASTKLDKDWINANCIIVNLNGRRLASMNIPFIDTLIDIGEKM